MRSNGSGPLTAISLFTGAGGLDLGCEMAGFATLAAVECDETARATIAANHASFFPELSPGAFLKDILSVEPERLLRLAGCERGDVDLLHGGPPCTPFSKSGYWLEYKRNGADPKASLLDEYVRVLAGVKPRAFIMENVFGLAYRKSSVVFGRFLEGVHEAGYVVDYKVLLAADYGVPQLRQRLFCVGLRRDLLDAVPDEWCFRWPDQTNAGPHETRRSWDASLPPHRVAGDALADLSDVDNPPEREEVVDGTFAEELRGVPPGENYLWWTEGRGHPAPRFKWRSRYWSFLLKLSPHLPAPTIQGQPGPWVGPFHWDNRRLRLAEVKRLMTFPDGYVVLGSRRNQQLQLGNAVPPQLAQALAGAVRMELARLNAIPPIEARPRASEAVV